MKIQCKLRNLGEFEVFPCDKLISVIHCRSTKYQIFSGFVPIVLTIHEKK